MLSPAQSVLARCMEFEEEPPLPSETIRRPLAFRFDFIEIFAGTATVITAEVAALGYSVGCPIVKIHACLHSFPHKTLHHVHVCPIGGSISRTLEPCLKRQALR